LLVGSTFEAFGIRGQSSKEEIVSCITSTEMGHQCWRNYSEAVASQATHE